MFKRLILHSNQIYPLSIEQDSTIFKWLNTKNITLNYVASMTSPTNKYFLEIKKYYEQLGISQIKYYDFDKTVQNNDGQLFNGQVIHLSGGCTSTFLTSLIQHKVIDKIIQFVENGGVLIGVSAGAILMSKTIEIVSLLDEPLDKQTKSLGLTNFDFLPHFDNTNEMLLKIKNYSQKYQTTVYACEEGAGLIVDNDTIYQFGNVVGGSII